MARIPGEKEGAFRRGFAGLGVQMFGQPVVPPAVSAEARVRAINPVGLEPDFVGEVASAFRALVR